MNVQSGLASEVRQAPRRIEEIDAVVIRFAGDSGDGMQLTGTEFAHAVAVAGHDFSTHPDFPSEIRAPAGSLFGVSGYQIQYSSNPVRTSGDELDVLVAMNPAALKVNHADVKREGLLIVNTGAFTEANLAKAGYASDPLTDGTLDGRRFIGVDITQLNSQSPLLQSE